jgi:adenylate cyclase
VDSGSPGAGAIAFTDIVGYTQFTADRGDAAAVALLDLQTRIVRDALPDAARIVKELGDGLLLWFVEPVSAVTTCLALLEEFTRAGDATMPLWVRIGMHWGRPARRGDDLVGHDVNLAARIADMSGPGELLVSAAVCGAVGDAITRLCVSELGPVVMRGIPDPVPLFRVTSPGGNAVR